MVASTLIGTDATSGIPLFMRHVGQGTAPPFVLVASLNGLHVFGEAQGVINSKAISQNSAIIWKTFCDRIRLILIHGNNSCSDDFDNLLLDLAFASLTLFIGRDNLTAQTNSEKLKRELRPCYSVLDEILSRLIGLKDDKCSFSHLTNCVEYIMTPDQLNIQPEIDKFSEIVETSQCCLFEKFGRILFATKNFWGLSSVELVLLSLLLSCEPFRDCMSRDMLVYLPDKSPNVPLRLLTVSLAGALVLVSICGSKPSLTGVIKSANQFWGSHYLTLDAIAMAASCSIPASIHSSLDPVILGLLLVNRLKKRYLSCVHFKEKHETRSCISGNARKHDLFNLRGSVLCSAYRSLAGSFTSESDLDTRSQGGLNGDKHPVAYAYISAEDFKVFFLQRSSFQILVLYPPYLPIHFARDITRKTFEILTKNKAARV